MAGQSEIVQFKQINFIKKRIDTLALSHIF